MTELRFLLELAGEAALLLWGLHMVQSGVQRAFGSRLRQWLGVALGGWLATKAPPISNITTELGSGIGLLLRRESRVSSMEIRATRKSERDPRVGMKLIDEGFFSDEADMRSFSADLDTLHKHPANKRLSWRYGISHNVLNKRLRVGEVANWIELQVLPTRTKRGRG